MDAKTWVQVMAGAMTGPPRPRNATALAVYAPRLSAEFPGHAFTADTARSVGKRYQSSDPPEYDALAGALRFAMPATTAPEPGTSDTVRDHWFAFASLRLRSGANREHVLSLVRRYAEPDVLPEILRALFRPEYDAELERQAEVAAAKAARDAAPLPASDPPRKPLAEVHVPERNRQPTDREKLDSLRALVRAGSATAATLSALHALEQRIEVQPATPQPEPAEAPPP